MELRPGAEGCSEVSACSIALFMHAPSMFCIPQRPCPACSSMFCIPQRPCPGIQDLNSPDRIDLVQELRVLPQFFQISKLKFTCLQIEMPTMKIELSYFESNTPIAQSDFTYPKIGAIAAHKSSSRDISNQRQINFH